MEGTPVDSLTPLTPPGGIEAFVSSGVIWGFDTRLVIRSLESMDDSADNLERALSLIEQAHEIAAEAASILRDAVDYDELAYATIRVEAELGMLGVQIRHARFRAQA